MAWAQAGTTRALVNNMVHGVTHGFSVTLELVGVGYRAQGKGSSITLSLGFSHPIEYNLPEGVAAETPNVTTIVLTGIDKQKVGQVASEIRAFRPPEPYKGKGIKYANEFIVRKEAKKK
jgi:large subunit ribosomal protein L6